ncbi:hypothetical protein AJ78_08264 [Emergomyces pasteurianus Ep9510]|uniref:Uncharacterized protein n=1 Tax=Emergomyces pasteurianus Ep9510 TaxID=1447872 RepID=A0A1J9Q4I0_9EURO|nr:hypothetical protein AJ78_08264 [Emergomyces pasteurianus Ep9510]
MTVVDEEWLKAQLSDVVIKRTLLIPICEVDQNMSNRAVVILLHFPAILLSGCHIIVCLKVEAHLLPRLKVNLLLGIDNMAPEEISLNIPGRKAVFTHCQNAQAVITVRSKRHHQPARTVFASMRVTLPSHSAARVLIRLKREHNLSNDCDYLFKPGRKDIAAHIHAIDTTLLYIHIENKTNEEVVIPRRAKLGFLREYDHTDIWQVEAMKVSLTNEESIPPNSSMNDKSGQPVPSVSISSTLTISKSIQVDSDPCLQQVTPLSVTVYKKPEANKRFATLIEKFTDVFIDTGGIVNISKKEWMRVHIKPGAKILKNVVVYPLGKRGQQILDENFNKLHQQRRMS